MSNLKKFAWNVSRIIAQNGGPVSKFLYGAAHLYVRTYNNLNYDMETNGEFHLLDRLSTVGIETVFDVGANKGEYTQACLSRFPRATIHAFEAAPPTFEKLVGNVASDRVRLNPVGLSDAEGTLVLNYNPADDGLSSLIEGKRIHDGDWRSFEVPLTTGDRYCETNSIATIDFLKIDVEGAEGLVLHGFETMFAEKAISAVQFEFGMTNIYSKFLLVDFWSFFSERGFVVGPIMPRGVEFKDYNPRDETFQGPPNFLAVHRSRSDMIAAVGLGR